MEAYLKIRGNLYYCISTTENIKIVTSVNINKDARQKIRESISLPSAYVTDVEVITKEEFDDAYNIAKRNEQL